MPMTREQMLEQDRACRVYQARADDALEAWGARAPGPVVSDSPDWQPRRRARLGQEALHGRLFDRVSRAFSQGGQASHCESGSAAACSVSALPDDAGTEGNEGRRAPVRYQGHDRRAAGRGACCAAAATRRPRGAGAERACGGWIVTPSVTPARCDWMSIPWKQRTNRLSACERISDVGGQVAGRRVATS